VAIATATPILHVEDFPLMVRVTRELLRRIGLADVDHATDGEAALRMIGARKYGLILADWNMAPVDGMELLRRLRGDPATEKLRFIMVTAESRTEMIMAARDAGANGYLVKPFNAATLKAKIEQALAA
jgi:two-component system chemotaxis response regulator CheY